MLDKLITTRIIWCNGNIVFVSVPFPLICIVLPQLILYQAILVIHHMYNTLAVNDILLNRILLLLGFKKIIVD